MRSNSLLAASVAVLLAAGAATAAAPAAAAKLLVNTDKHGVALQGYDPVAFFTDGKAVKGSADIQFSHGGAVYYFASAEHRDLFTKDPAHYAPRFGGFCAYGVAQGHAVSVQISTWQIYQGHLILNYNDEVKQRFDKDRDGNLAKAEGNWPGIVEKEGKAPSN